jgi:hypothetical protein
LLASLLVALPHIGTHFTPPFISLTRREYEVDYVVLELLDMVYYSLLRRCIPN